MSSYFYFFFFFCKNEILSFEITADNFRLNRVVFLLLESDVIGPTCNDFIEAHGHRFTEEQKCPGALEQIY